MKPVIIINHLRIKPGKLEEFIAAQQGFAAKVAPCGLLGGRMYRGADGLSAVLVSTFESESAQREVQQRPEFGEHLERLKALVDSSGPGLYEEAYTYGDFR